MTILFLPVAPLRSAGSIFILIGTLSESRQWLSGLRWRKIEAGKTGLAKSVLVKRETERDSKELQGGIELRGAIIYPPPFVLVRHLRTEISYCCVVHYPLLCHVTSPALIKPALRSSRAG